MSDFEVGQTVYDTDGYKAVVQQFGGGPSAYYDVLVTYDTGEEGWMCSGSLLAVHSAPTPPDTVHDASDFIEWTERLLGRSIPEWQQRQMVCIWNGIQDNLVVEEDRQFVTVSDEGKTVNINLEGVHPDNWVGVLARESAQRLNALEMRRMIGGEQ